MLDVVTEHPGQHRARHISALALGLCAVVVLFLLPGGVVTYAVMVGIALIALVFGQRAVRHRGPLLWAAILGLVLASLGLITNVSFLVVRAIRVFSG
ncbi:hypothetical protein GCM10009847_21460 [Leucobacter tardus]